MAREMADFALPGEKTGSGRKKPPDGGRKPGFLEIPKNPVPEWRFFTSQSPDFKMPLIRAVQKVNFAKKSYGPE